MFGITDPDDAAWLAARMRPQPLRTFTESDPPERGRRPDTGHRHLLPAADLCLRQFAEAIGYRTVAWTARTT